MASVAEVQDEEEVSQLTPAPAELVERAWVLVRKHPDCFWFRHPDARVRTLADVRLVIERLRQHGGWHAWKEAQELYQCLSPLYRKTH